MCFILLLIKLVKKIKTIVYFLTFKELRNEDKKSNIIVFVYQTALIRIFHSSFLTTQ